MAKLPLFATLGPEADQVGLFLRAVYRLHQGLVRQASPMLEQAHDIDLKLYMVLKCVEGGLVHPSEIAQNIQAPASVVTRHLSDLIGRGLLTRAVDDMDARRFRLSMTEAGAATLAAADRDLAAMVGARLHAVPDEPRAQFLALLGELSEDFNPA